ncbi:MAG: RCC1 repeat-containing protein [Verrucomicrobiota bacterium]
MKHRLLRLALAAPLFVLSAWPRANFAQAAISYAVVAWGNNEYGQTTVPVAAQSGVTAIAAGYLHTVALKNDGSVVAWGLNNFGQTTVPVAAQSGVTAIAAGTYHTVALKHDGTVVAWGYNGSGAVAGTPSANDLASPVTLGGQVLSGVTAIAAGWGFTVALMNDGSVVAWGDNDSGQTTVPVAAQSGVTAIAAGGAHTVALKNDGSVVAWGRNDMRQTVVPVAGQSGVTAIAAGIAHTVALKTDGSVVAWGNNSYGEVTGTPTTKAPYFAGASPVTLGGQVLSGVTAIAAGEFDTVALKSDGSVVAWGYNNSGQTTVPMAAQSGVTAIAARGWNTVALVIPTAPNITTQPAGQAVNLWQSASFSVVATGYPLHYQWRKDGVDLAGATSATYRLPSAQTNQAGTYTVVVSNSAGSVTSAPPAVLTVNPIVAPGTVVAWGRNGDGQTTVAVAGQSGVVAIAAAAAHSVALKDDGSVVAWGSDCCGQTDVPIAAQSGVTAIAAGTWHTVALKHDGTVVAWGANGDGQVTGTPATDGWPYSATAGPVTLGGQVLSGVTAIAAGTWHTVALKRDGTVVAWGNNNFGQVTGTPPTNATYSAIASPVVLGGQLLTGVKAIAAGMWHTLALQNDGTLVAWGANSSGQVTGTPTPDGPYSAIGSPVALRSQILTGLTAITAGSVHNAALKNDGTVVAWGNNTFGQVTDTPTIDESLFGIANPVSLRGQLLGGVTAIAASSPVIATELSDVRVSHTVALKNDGTVAAWGYNRDGQVTGTPTTDDLDSAVASPVTLEGHILSGVTAIAAGHFQTVALIGGVQLLPSLKVSPSGDEVILSWPTNAPGFTLQFTPTLSPPMTWLDSPSVPRVTGAHFTLTNANTGARFYRLRKM